MRGMIARTSQLVSFFLVGLAAWAPAADPVIAALRAVDDPAARGQATRAVTSELLAADRLDEALVLARELSGWRRAAALFALVEPVSQQRGVKAAQGVFDEAHQTDISDAAAFLPQVRSAASIALAWLDSPEAALATVPAILDFEEEARAQREIARRQAEAGDWPAAVETSGKIRVSRRYATHQPKAIALATVATAASRHGAAEAAADLLAQAEALFATSQAWTDIEALCALAEAAHQCGDPEMVQRTEERLAARLAALQGDWWPMEAGRAAMALQRSGRAETARAWALQALERVRSQPPRIQLESAGAVVRALFLCGLVTEAAGYAADLRRALDDVGGPGNREAEWVEFLLAEHLLTATPPAARE
jgi:hypothetical protein